MTTPSGQSVTYGYTNNKVSSISVNGTTVLSGVAYEPFGPARTWTWGNATTEIRAHDTDGNVSQISNLESTSYTLDNAFRITGISNASTPSLSWTYGYDNLDRLTSANAAASISWTYDANGNRQTQVGASGQAYAASNITLSYNNRGRMSGATGLGSSSYTYNALGQRIYKNGNSGNVVFMYDESGHLLGEYDSGGALIEETVWLGDIPVATLRPGSPAAIYYVHADHLNTPKMITRPSDNTIVWRWDQDPFGTAPPNQNPSAQGLFVYNLRYPGQYFDSETGLSYNYFRDYDPQVGRYVESDPIGLGGGNNLYLYAGGRPTIEADPTGQFGLPGAVGSALFNLGMQFLVNYELSKDWQRAARCINFSAVGVSFGLGFIGPTAFGNVVRGTAGPGGLGQAQNAYLYIAKILPAGWALKKGIPALRIGSDCECRDLNLGKLVGEITQ